VRSASRPRTPRQRSRTGVPPSSVTLEPGALCCPGRQAIGNTEREFRQAIRAHLDDRHVGLGIGTDGLDDRNC